MISFRCKPFYELTAPQLYSIMALRQEVFVVEQNCAYLDADGHDQRAWHLMGRDKNGQLVLYTRLLPLGASYPGYTSIGRVLNHQSVRGTGAGQLLMWKSIDTQKVVFT